MPDLLLEQIEQAQDATSALYQYGRTMVDPFTGLTIPKDLSANLAWRKQLLKQANTSASIRRMLKSAAASSSIFWLNLFGWTFLQKSIDGAGEEKAVFGDMAHVPFVTWKVQDDALVELHRSIDHGRDVMIRKARDLGASWIVLSAFQHYWQFRPSSTFLELSRKEKLVDRPGDMDSLFEKHRYLMRWQPEWLRPARIVDNKLHLENRDIGTTLEGESTNENAGQASRKTAILLDEFARVERGEEIDLATADTSACRIFNSTPGGPNTHFARIYREMRAGTRKGTIIILPWWRHPAKGAGATRKPDPITGELKWTSPWYEIQLTRRSKRNVAQNLDMEDGKSGDLFFDPDEIEKHRKLYARPPVAEGNLLFDDEMGEAAKLALIRNAKFGKHAAEAQGRGQALTAQAIRFVGNGTRRPWRFWVPLIDGRPNQETRYILGVDISAGSGASNSVISVLDATSNMVVAKFWDAYTSPEDLAEVAAFAGVWFGGKQAPLLVFEKNGPGVIFGKKLIKLNYPNVYYQKTKENVTETATKRWGWASSPARKEMLLGEYREALKLGTIINPCEAALNEALDYVYDDSGRLEPGTFGAEEGGGKALHGDHVIADALLVEGKKSLPRTEPDPPARPPAGSFADRRKAWKNHADREKAAWSK